MNSGEQGLTCKVCRVVAKGMPAQTDNRAGHWEGSEQHFSKICWAMQCHSKRYLCRSPAPTGESSILHLAAREQRSVFALLFANLLVRGQASAAAAGLCPRQWDCCTPAEKGSWCSRDGFFISRCSFFSAIYGGEGGAHCLVTNRTQ